LENEKSMFEDFRDFYDQMILDHSKRPRNFRLLQDPNKSIQGYNPICGDDITLYFNFENGLIRDISFQGKGCALCTASASMLTESAKGKTVSEAENLFNRMRELITTGKGDAELGKLSVFSAVHRRPERIKCAILPWHALMGALKGEAKPVSTENEQT
jgi:nitrogen fixation NifU-like protein